MSEPVVGGLLRAKLGRQLRAFGQKAGIEVS